MEEAGRNGARRRLLELAALESSILDAVPQAIVGLHNRQIIFANNAVRDVFGWDSRELVGRSVTVFYRSDEESDEIARYFYATLQRQRTFVNEFPCRHKDGRDILCRMRAARIGEKLIERRIVITYEDITEKKRADEELKLSREKLRNLSLHLQSVREKEAPASHGRSTTNSGSRSPLSRWIFPGSTINSRKPSPC
jgi:PAS domain S-box-containing protein